MLDLPKRIWILHDMGQSLFQGTWQDQCVQTPTRRIYLGSLVADCIPRMNVWSAISGLMPLVVRLWRHSVDFFEAQPYYGSKGVQARIPMDSMKTWLPTMDPVAPRGDGWPMTSAMWSCLRILAPLRSLSNYQPFRCTTASFRIS